MDLRKVRPDSVSSTSSDRQPGHERPVGYWRDGGRAKHQLRVPQDVAVVGFDDIPAAKVIAPQLTTVHQPMEEKGRLAALSLLKENGPLRLRLPTKLVIRESTTAALPA
jgi:Periplasmic binding protein-like domain